MQRTHFVLLLGSILMAGCGQTVPSATATASIITSTLPPTQSSSPTPPPETATTAATAVPILGATSTQLNVRQDPSSAGPPIGVIDAYAPVQILGKDPSSSWYQIQYPKAKDGLGWVTSQYVIVQSAGSIPVVRPGTGASPIGVITQQVNVRSGPGTDAGSVGILNARDVVSLTGKDAGGLWLQIQYAGATDGKGWIASGYVQASGLDQLPIVAGTGQVIGTETPTGVPPTPIPTLATAADDHDSADAPAADVLLSPAGAGSFMYSSDLSAPGGDAADWIRFSPYGTRVIVRLDCEPAGPINLALSAEGVALPSQNLPGCGSSQVLDLVAGRRYVIQVSLSTPQTKPIYTHYTITIQSLPH